MSNTNNEVYLAKNRQSWAIHLAEKLLANSQPWGPPAYVLGTYTDDPEQPDQSNEFLKLASFVDGAYERHGDIGDAWHWASPILAHIKEIGSCTEYTTQDLLDIVFLCARGERFRDGLIRSTEPTLRVMLQEVVRRVHSSSAPVFLAQKE